MHVRAWVCIITRFSLSALYASGCEQVPVSISCVHEFSFYWKSSTNVLHHGCYLRHRSHVCVRVCVCRTGVAGPVGDRLLSTEEQVTLITESMTVSSTDQEKVLLLNKNTELRRVNKEVQSSAGCCRPEWAVGVCVKTAAKLRKKTIIQPLFQNSSPINKNNN